MTRAGAISSMVGGFAIVVGLSARGEIYVLGLHPAMWGLVGSFTLGVLVSKLSGPPRQDLVAKYFYEPLGKK
jgi:Na+/proline symporter